MHHQLLRRLRARPARRAEAGRSGVERRGRAAWPPPSVRRLLRRLRKLPEEALPLLLLLLLLPEEALVLPELEVVV